MPMANAKDLCRPEGEGASHPLSDLIWPSAVAVDIRLEVVNNIYTHVNCSAGLLGGRRHSFRKWWGTGEGIRECWH